MAVVVVGGGGRGVGKTALVCGVLTALPEPDWIAVKITGHPHDAPAVWEEREPGERTDTARYLAAGARRAFLLTTTDHASMQSALEELWQLIERKANLIFESNRVLDFLDSDLCLMVWSGADDPAVKTSFESAINRADAVITGGAADALRDGLPPEFELARLERISPELEGWIRGRLGYDLLGSR